LSNPTKGWGAKCIPIAYYRLIRGYWQNFTETSGGLTNLFSGCKD
jgi:hypothetical protein